MRSLSPLVAATATGLLSGLAITQAVAGHSFIAALCAMGAALAGLWWSTARRADEARLLAALFPQHAPRPASEGHHSNHREQE